MFLKVESLEIICLFIIYFLNDFLSEFFVWVFFIYGLVSQVLLSLLIFRIFFTVLQLFREFSVVEISSWVYRSIVKKLVNLIVCESVAHGC